MPHIIYADEEARFTGRPVPYSQQDAVRHWGRHYANFRMLDFVFRSTDDPAERRQAAHEMTICSRKMEHWQRHGNWVAEEAARERARADALWDSARAGG